jgi:hypothetical protein
MSQLSFRSTEQVADQIPQPRILEIRICVVVQNVKGEVIKPAECPYGDRQEESHQRRLRYAQNDSSGKRTQKKKEHPFNLQ